MIHFIEYEPIHRVIFWVYAGLCFLATSERKKTSAGKPGWARDSGNSFQIEIKNFL